MKALSYAAALALLPAFLVAWGANTSAVAAPGSPGIPGDPTVLFHEDFENGLGGTGNVLLVDYVGSQSTTYGGTPYWTEPSMCNGIVIRNNSSAPALCGGTAATHIRQMANALGVVNGTADTLQNHAVSAYTNAPTGTYPLAAGDVEFQTTTPIAVPAGSRFLTFSVNAASVNCHASAALMRFYLKDGATEIPATDAAINVCTDPAASLNAGYQSGSFTSDSSVLFSGTQLDIVMRNDNGSATGNDHAYDDIKVLDATPQLDKSFAERAKPYVVGDSVPLTFTVTNTSELAAKTGWAFTDTLPAGMEVAATPNASTTCAAGTVTADAGTDLVKIDGGSIAAGVASCTITVDVTVDEPGSFVNGPGNVDTTGLKKPGDSTVVFEDPAPALEVVKDGTLNDTNGNGLADLGETIDYSFEVSNTGNVDLVDVSVTDAKVTGLTPASADIAWDAAARFSADPYEVTQADIDRGHVLNSATASGAAPNGDDVTSPPAESRIRGIEREPAMDLMKTAELDDKNGNGLADKGEKITYSFEVTNTGNVTLFDVRIDDSKVDGLDDAVLQDLAPGEVAILESDPYTVTEADVRSGEVANTAVAVAKDFDGIDVESDPSSATVDTVEYEAGILPDTGVDPGMMGLILGGLGLLGGGGVLVSRIRRNLAA